MKIEQEYLKLKTTVLTEIKHNNPNRKIIKDAFDQFDKMCHLIKSFEEKGIQNRDFPPYYEPKQRSLKQ